MSLRVAPQRDVAISWDPKIQPWRTALSKECISPRDRWGSHYGSKSPRTFDHDSYHEIATATAWPRNDSSAAPSLRGAPQRDVATLARGKGETFLCVRTRVATSLRSSQ